MENFSESEEEKSKTARMEELSKSLSEHTKMQYTQDWIDPSDRTPDHNMFVEVNMGNNFMHAKFFQMDDSLMDYWIDKNGNKIEYEKVIFWRELAQQPEIKPIRYIYVSGKISGLTMQEAADNFARAEEKVRQLGFEPVNPLSFEEHQKIRFLHQTEVLTEREAWVLHMKVDLIEMLKYDAIFLMKDYLQSDGAQIEAWLGRKLKYEIVHEAEPPTDILEKVNEIN